MERAAGRSLLRDPVTAGLLVYGLYQLALGLVMTFAAGWFFRNVGPFGIRNDHYIGDVGSFYLASAFGVGMAAVRPSWRVPILTVGAVWYGLHALNHLFDIGEARSTARGVIDTVLLTLGAILLAWLANVAQRERRPERLARPPR